MPKTKKLKKIPQKPVESSSEDDSMSENESSASETGDEEIMIDFEARSIEESDIDSVQLLVQQKLGIFQLNINETAKIIVQQDNIGNVIFQGLPANENEDENMEASNSNDDSTIFGVLSLIDLSSARVKSYSAAFKQFLLKESQRFDTRNAQSITSTINDILKNKKVSFVINERFVNIPPAISVPMFESLLSDLETIKSSNVENDFSSDYWLFISKRFETDPEEQEANNTNTEPNLIYANPEEEVFEEFSEFKFEITGGKQTAKSTNGKWTNKDPVLMASINCLIVPFDKIKDCIEKIKTLL